MKIRIVDVGARGGVHARWNDYIDRIDVVAFEPDFEECTRLSVQAPPYKIKYLPYALGAKDGEKATLHVCRKPGCSSLLRPNMDLCSQFAYAENMEVVGTQEVTLHRLDTVCKDFQPDVLKVDTQGTELAVLEGAGNLLDGTTAVELEVEFVPQHIGQAMFSDIDAFMRSRGFMLRGLRRTYWRHRGDYAHAAGGQLMHGDALYLRPDLLNNPTGHAILAAYRQYDLLSHFGADHLIPPDPWHKGLLARILSGWSNKDLRRMVDRLRPAIATDWHDPDFY